jgi:hypothetical protein
MFLIIYLERGLFDFDLHFRKRFESKIGGFVTAL